MGTVRIDRARRYVVRFTNDAGESKEVAVLAFNPEQAQQRAMFHVDTRWFLNFGAVREEDY